MRNWILVALLAASTAVCEVKGQGEPSQMPADEVISKHIVGKWVFDEVSELNLKIRGTANYNKDGTFEGEAVIGNGDDPAKIKLTGTWTVAKGIIISTVTKSSLPVVVAKGASYKFQVISIDEAVLKYKNEADKEFVRKRHKG